MNDALLAAVASQFRALGEPARLRILRRLLEGDASIGQLADEFGWSQANASKHVAILVVEGFVARRRDGASNLCTIADPVVSRLCDLMCTRTLARFSRGLDDVLGS